MLRAIWGEFQDPLDFAIQKTTTWSDLTSAQMDPTHSPTIPGWWFQLKNTEFQWGSFPQVGVKISKNETTTYQPIPNPFLTHSV